MTPYSDTELSPAEEPTLEEMLADPIIQLIMQRDGVSQHEMQRTLGHLQSKYADIRRLQ